MIKDITPLFFEITEIELHQLLLKQTELGNDFVHIPVKNSDLLISCVHGLPHLRGKSVKPADTGTLEFSYFLAKLLNASWVSVVKENIVDNNNYRDTPLKSYLEKMPIKPKVCVDVHASSVFRPFDIEIGTGLNRENIAKELEFKKYLEYCGYLTLLNTLFCAKGSETGSQTMTSFWQTLGVTAFQLEIVSSLLIPESKQDIHQRSKLLYHIATGINNFIST